MHKRKWYNTLILLLSIKRSDEYAVVPQKHDHFPVGRIDFSHTGGIQRHFKALEIALFTKIVTYAAKRNM